MRFEEMLKKMNNYKKDTKIQLSFSDEGNILCEMNGPAFLMMRLLGASIHSIAKATNKKSTDILADLIMEVFMYEDNFECCGFGGEKEKITPEMEEVMKTLLHNNDFETLKQMANDLKNEF